MHGSTHRLIQPRPGVGRMEAKKQLAPTRRLRLAELTSGLGAGILGLGLGVLAADYLRGLGVLILLAGLLLHAWGMADKHRLETTPAAPGVWWSTLFYWICWAVLAVVAAYAITRWF